MESNEKGKTKKKTKNKGEDNEDEREQRNREKKNRVKEGWKQSLLKGKNRNQTEILRKKKNKRDKKDGK